MLKFGSAVCLKKRAAECCLRGITVDTKRLDEALFHKYIAPIQRRRTDRAGLEFELPVVNLAGGPVDFSVVHALTGAFLARFGFGDEHRDDDVEIYCATDPVSGDTRSYDCSYNTLELSFGTQRDLNVVYDRFRVYYGFIQEFLRSRGHTLTGMGVNPRREVNHNIPVANGRYRMLLHHLQSYVRYGDLIDFHSVPNFGLFACASQVQLDVDEDTVIEALNTFSRLEPLKALLFANSPYGPLLCARDWFWKNSMHGVNPRNVDAYDQPLGSIDDLLDYIRGMSLYCLERDGKYLNFAPTPLTDYFSRETVRGEYYADGGYHTLDFKPDLEDLAYLRSFKFEDLTFRGTIEFRSVCQQPVRQIMAPSAFHVGLMERLPELTALLEREAPSYEKGRTPSELRALFVRRDLPEDLDREKVSALLEQVLDLARDGLVQRGHGEEKFLAPLFDRAKTLKSPARELVEGLENGTDLEYYIEEFAKLD